MNDHGTSGAGMASAQDIEPEDGPRTDVLRSCAYDVATVRSLERPLLDDGVPLMRMAAAAAAHRVLDVIDEQGWEADTLRVCVLAGAGDNGGDGLYCGAMLADEGLNVTAIAVGRSLHDEAYAAFRKAGGHVFTLDPNASIPGAPVGFSSGEAGARLEQAVRFTSRAHIIIDAMTGIGVNGALHGIPAAIAEVVGTHGAPPRPALPDDELDIEFPFVLAIDTPSGVGVGDGTLPGAYIPADVTMMFGALKPCAMLPPACYACGRVTLVDFGFDVDAADPDVEIVDRAFAQSAIRIPRLDDAKYERGVAGLITGSDAYPGAAVLSACAAARSNIGMVRYLGPDRAQDLVLHALPEAVIGKGHVQSWVVGCGIPDGVHGDDKDLQRTRAKALLAHYSLDGDEDGRRAALAMPPIVVDAGALDLLPAHVPAHVVVTPHAGEMAALLTRLGEARDPADVSARPLAAARRACELTGATVLLKGAMTVIVGADDDGATRTLVCGRAPAFLSTAGAGDVLAGITGAMLAQQADEVVADPSLAAEIVAGAAYVHGLAAALASHSDQRAWNEPELFSDGDEDTHAPQSVGHPIVAMDVVNALPAAFDMLNATARYE